MFLETHHIFDFFDRNVTVIACAWNCSSRAWSNSKSCCSFSSIQPCAFAAFNLQDWRWVKGAKIDFLVKYPALRFSCVILVETYYWNVDVCIRNYGKVMKQEHGKIHRKLNNNLGVVNKFMSLRNYSFHAINLVVKKVITELQCHLLDGIHDTTFLDETPVHPSKRHQSVRKKSFKI